MALIQSNNRLRFGAGLTVKSQNRLRYSTHRVQTCHNRLRFAAGKLVQSHNLVRYLSMTGAYGRAWTQGTTGDPNSLPQISILAGGMQLCPAPYALQVTLTESGAAKWEVRIQDQHGYYHPKNASSPWFGKLTRGTSIIVRVTWEGAEFNLVGVGTGHGHSRNWKDAGKFDFVWHGIDLSGALFRKGVTMPTLRSTRDLVVTTRSAMADLLSGLGIRYNLDLMEPSNIRLQNRQDMRPGDAFQALADVLWHEWIYRGSMIYVYKPNYYGPAQWHYGAGQAAILEDDTAVDEPAFVNSVTSRRAQESNSSLPAKEHDAYGRFTEKFNPPIEGLYYRKLSEQGGRFSDFYLKRGGGVVSIRETRGAIDSGLTSAVAGPIDEVVYTWGTVGGFTLGGYGKIQFRGAEQDLESQGWANDPIRSLTRVNQTSLDAGDPLNHQELQPNALLADARIVERHADGYLIKQAANVDPQNFGVPLNLLMMPGQRVQIHDDRLGTDEVRYVRQHTLTIGTSLDLCSSRIATTYFSPTIMIGDPL